MYDVLEGASSLASPISVVLTDHTAHRWAVLERNIIHRDISHPNVILRAEDSRGRVKAKSNDEENRAIFANEASNGYA